MVTTIRDYKSVNIERKRDASRTRRFVASTSGIDRDCDTIDQSGWKLDNYKNNPVVLWAHDYSRPPIGRADVDVVSGQLVADISFATDPFASSILELIDDGFLGGLSVGFRPLASTPNGRGGLTYTSTELLELSVVPVPANPMALVVARQPAIKAWIRETQAKTGRMLSASSEETIRGAAAYCARAAAQLQELLDMLVDDDDTEPIDLPDADVARAVAAGIASAVKDVVPSLVGEAVGRKLAEMRGRLWDPIGDPATRHRVADGHRVIDVDAQTAKDAIRAGTLAALPDRDALAAFVRQETTRTLNRLRGRLD